MRGPVACAWCGTEHQALDHVAPACAAYVIRRGDTVVARRYACLFACSNAADERASVTSPAPEMTLAFTQWRVSTDEEEAAARAALVAVFQR